ncbi:AAA domain-containing protein [Anaeromyxobacter dehalogenans]|uniref:Superfamily I DNA and RNA helicase n=1 Tax=Anaeromyxobacter dehalogenans (strain 2CP-C) TaxID=290397 RepID=Q2IHB9_ANADE|nr:AAA domain-containing protein [Anaeromyxobacter dehalogenans]ABC83980.1 Superfamily I DNA and RNA helicase [Anaeromyxobacter dehalogenans 2CP-C]
MDLAHHLDRLAALLAAERDEERARFAEAKGRLSLAEREARGLAIADVEAQDEGALAGRALVTFGRGGRPLPGGRIGAGSLVSVAQRRDTPPDAPQGVVARRTRTTVAVAFDEPPPDWVTDGRVVLELEPSPVTWERLSGGLRRLRDDRAGKRWHAVLAGEPARFLRAPRGPALDAPLNPEQQAALELADRAEDLALVHGPPGTGKTTVLVEVIRRAAARGETVLAAAPSNLAVDNLVERLAAAGLACVRVGHPARVLPGLLEHTLEARVEAHEAARIAQDLVDQALALRRDARKRRKKRGPGRFSASREQEREARALLAEARRLEARAEAEVLERAQVVLATLTSLDAPALAGRRFALAVVDEATQAVEPAAYLALLRADRAVLAGDHLQLPPTVLSAAAQAGGLGVSLFERLVEAHGDRARVMLAEQHRMNARIMAFPSEALYGGALRAHPAAAGRAIDDAPLELVDTSGRGFEEETPEGSDSKQNAGEAELAASEVRRLLAAGLAPADVAVISPYDAQVQRLRQLLADELEAGLEVDTVDGFQGREKEAVVVSLVRSNEAGEVGFLADVRRMNVALTRARAKLVVVGDGSTVSRHPFYRSFLEHAERAGAWRSAWER